MKPVSIRALLGFSVWRSLPRSARRAAALSLLLSAMLLSLGGPALPRALGLDQSPEIRRLQKPGADVLRRTCLQSHLEVIQVSPLRVVATVLCDRQTFAE